MINKKYLKLLRSKRNKYFENFIYDQISKRIVDSLDILNMDFEKVLELGINDNKIHNYLYTKFPNSTFTRLDLSISNIHNSNNTYLIEDDLENIKLKKNYYNLVFSNFYCHLFNSFDIILTNIKNSLNNDGFFIASIPDSDNIYELVNSMYRTDALIYNGTYQRINPTHKINYILDSLKKLNFNNPSINSDIISIEYSKFYNLLKEVKHMNLSYCYNDKRNFFEKKNYFRVLEEEYKKNYFNKNFELTIKFNIISAWKNN